MNKVGSRYRAANISSHCVPRYPNIGPTTRILCAAIPGNCSVAVVRFRRCFLCCVAVADQSASRIKRVILFWSMETFIVWRARCLETLVISDAGKMACVEVEYATRLQHSRHVTVKRHEQLFWRTLVQPTSLTFVDWLINLLFDWSIGWLIDWLIDWILLNDWCLVRSLIDLLVNLICWLDGWLICLGGWSNDWVIDWLTSWFGRLIEWSIDCCLTDNWLIWLIDLLFGCLIGGLIDWSFDAARAPKTMELWNGGKLLVC